MTKKGKPKPKHSHIPTGEAVRLRPALKKPGEDTLHKPLLKARIRHAWREIAVSSGLAIAVLLVYLQTLQFQFIDGYDDVSYVLKNRMVQAGMTWAGMKWALTTFDAANWHPLTWFSHMLDCQLFGLDPGYHHLTSVIFHTINCILLFWILRRMTGRLWESAAVAALFALHPLHVESVAWIAERKDVLSAFWGLFTIWAYVRYVESPSSQRYMAVAVGLALGLMSKPMLVTLPFLLLLLDYWPLGRMHCATETSSPTSALKKLIIEKIPLFGLVVASSVVTFVAQRKGGAVVTLVQVPVSTRIGNAIVAYVDYLRDTFWPARLAAYYPLNAVSGWQVAISLVALVGITVFALWNRKRFPFSIVGWLWYLGMLVPVIGLVQAGSQARADRYTYLPLIGILVFLVFGAVQTEVIRRRPWLNGALAAMVLITLGRVCWLQVGYWQDSITLFSRAVVVTQNNWFAHYDLAKAMADQGRFSESRPHFLESVRINPEYPEAQVGYGYVLEQEGRLNEATIHYRQAISLKPAMMEAHAKLGDVLVRQGNIREATSCYAEAVRLNPMSPEAHNNLARALALQGRLAEAVAHLSEAVRLEPGWAEVHNNLGIALLRQGKAAEAIWHFSEAIRLKPDFAAARTHLEEADRSIRQ
jgi:tetratricopeptide (TPR) repeat protein